MTTCPYNSGLEPRIIEELLSLQRTTRSPHLLQELAGIYLEHLGPRLAALRQALEEEQLDDLEHILHKLGGSSGSIGAHRLMWLAQLLRTDVTRRQENYRLFLEEVEVVRAALDLWINP